MHATNKSTVARAAKTFAIVIATILSTVGPLAAAAQSIADFYRGKTIRVIVGSDAGGGYDIYARMVMRLMSKYLPGNPGFVVENMPGGGGLLAADYLYNIAARQGLDIGVIERGAPFDHLFNPKENLAKFDAQNFNWIGSPEQEIGLAFLRLPSPIGNIFDVRTRELVVSATTHTAPTSVYPRMLDNLFGMKFKVIEGYPSSQAALYALDRGEVEGHVSGASSGILRGQVAPWIAAGKVKVILQLGLKKDPAYPDAPLVTDLAGSTEEREILDLMFAQQTISYPFVAPPDVPADRVRALREAFDATMKDPEFRVDAERQHLQVDPIGGADIDLLLAKVEHTPPEILKRVTDLLGSGK
jgi:tripartite-type tricarboxylate transporter receptor subunit TctC